MGIDFDPDTKAKNIAGLVLGIAGPVLSIAGLMTYYSYCDGAFSGAQTCSVDGGAQTAVALMLIGGVVATPIGWTMFGTSFKPEYEIHEYHQQAPTYSSPARGNVRLGIAGSF